MDDRDLSEPARDPEAIGERAGDTIGRYRLLQELGEGGFGVVWMAEQTEPVRRRVALKIIKVGMDTRQVVARFEAERQVLALMDHPHIARVIDGGATESGRPYFVMDLVEGAPIVAYCDRNALTVPERLVLTADVCNAVQHAHGKGVIHRDLKPSNVLVEMHDGRPRVKVIDFGIAKATSQTPSERSLFTEYGQVIGTLQYMSPEQAEGSLDVDTRADVYALGILLYELLTGSTPFDVGPLRGAMVAELQRMIREVDPPRPSTRLSESADVLATIAARRGIEPRRLGPLLRGELDWIVMKALEKDRSRRYESASAMAADLRRYLAGEAVMAAPPGAAYRARKFVRRHRVWVTAGAAVALALLAGVVAFAWQADLAREQRDLARIAQRAESDQRRLADAQRDRAVQAEADGRARAAELRLVADFQAGMLEQIDATEAGRLLSDDVRARLAAALEKQDVPEDVRGARMAAFRREWSAVNATDAARTLIDRALLLPAVAAIDAQFADQPVVDAQLRQVLADRYRKLGLYDAALPLQTRALETRRRVLGEVDPRTLVSMDGMGLLLAARGEYAEAEGHARAVLETSRRVLGDEHAATLDRISNLGTVLASQGKLAAAEPFYREALEKQRRVHGDDDPATLTAINNMGYLLDVEGKSSEAEPYYREALEKCRRDLGEGHPLTLSAITNLGVLLHTEGRLDEAEPLYRAALEESRRVLGEEHPDTLSRVGNMGALLKYQGKLDEAEPYYVEALEKRRALLGEDHPDTLIALNNLGGLYLAEGMLAEAERSYREALEKKRGVLGDAHPSTLSSIISLGGLLNSLGRHAEAEDLLAPAEDDVRAAFPGDRASQCARFLTILGRVRTARDDFAAAEGNLLEAHDLYGQAPGPSAKDAQNCTQALVDLYAAWEAAAPGNGYAAKSADWRAGK